MQDFHETSLGVAPSILQVLFSLICMHSQGICTNGTRGRWLRVISEGGQFKILKDILYGRNTVLCSIVL